MERVLIIIPARGNSKGIPRKNLRSLAGKPLIYYSIQTALQAKVANTQIDVFVSSEDEEILTISKKFGANTIRRNKNYSKDSTTLDEVICNEVRQLDGDYDIIVTMQPTSPLLRVGSLEKAIEKMIAHPELDSMLSATNDSHLTWLQKGGKFIPNYEKRVNRQQLPQIFKETGGFIMCRSHMIDKNTRIGRNVDLYELVGEEAIDIDTFTDWNICEFYLKQSRIVFVVSGYKEIGMGHVYNVLSIANEILNHELLFLVDKKSQLAYNKIAENNYLVVMQEEEDLVDAARRLSPDVVINDRLDTEASEVVRMKEFASTVINFEDLGEGALHADLVFNAMYPEKEKLPNHFFGLEYFILRDEFLFSQQHQVKPEVNTILLCFGGVDPSNLTTRVLQVLNKNTNAQSMEIKVIVGMGYSDLGALKETYPHLEIVNNVSNISDYIGAADLVFTSGGRTTFECACLGVPTIVLCQNQRETTHFFAKDEYGFRNLGLGTEVSDEEINAAFDDCLDESTRKEMSNTLLSSNLKNGKKAVMQKIKNLIDK
ncbi:MAG: cytidylyltransferase domain-containing protein [Fluviicola sp.]